MQKIFKFGLVLVLVVLGFLSGRVTAKNSWQCLYGNCSKKGFAILQKDDLFFMGQVDKNVMKTGVMKDKNAGLFQYYVENESLVKMTESSIVFGMIGKDKNNKACIYKGYGFKLDLSAYEEYADEGCKPLK